MESDRERLLAHARWLRVVTLWFAGVFYTLSVVLAVCGVGFVVLAVAIGEDEALLFGLVAFALGGLGCLLVTFIKAAGIALVMLLQASAVADFPDGTTRINDGSAEPRP